MLLKSYLQRYIKDTTIVMILEYQPSKVKSNAEKVRRFALKALRNYSALRLKLLKNDTLMQLERKAVTSAIKAGLRYASKEFGITYDTKMDEAVDKIMPEVLDVVHNKRVDLITHIYEASCES